MFPVRCDDERWIEYLARINGELGVALSVRQHTARISIPLGSGCEADVVVVAFTVSKGPEV